MSFLRCFPLVLTLCRGAWGCCSGCAFHSRTYDQEQLSSHSRRPLLSIIAPSPSPKRLLASQFLPKAALVSGALPKEFVSPVGLCSPHDLEKIPRFHISVQSIAITHGSVTKIGHHKNAGNLLKPDPCHGFPSPLQFSRRQAARRQCIGQLNSASRTSACRCVGRGTVARGMASSTRDTQKCWREQVNPDSVRSEKILLELSMSCWSNDLHQGRGVEQREEAGMLQTYCLSTPVVMLAKTWNSWPVLAGILSNDELVCCYSCSDLCIK